MLDTMQIGVEAAPDTPEPACELGLMEALFVDFSSADTDGDGFVSKAEFASYRQKQTGAAPTADDWKAFYACDRNADGQISRAEFEQFKESTSVSSSGGGGGKPRLMLDTMQIGVEAAPDTPEPACELGFFQ
jgi:hypothetical protein